MRAFLRVRQHVFEGGTALYLAVDIGSTAIRGCVLKPASGALVLDVLDEVELADGAVINGVINDADAVVEALVELRTRNEIGHPPTVVSLPFAAAFVRDGRMSPRKGRYEIREARDLVEPWLPQHWQDIRIAIAPVDRGDDDVVVIVAAQREAIHSLQAVFQSAQLPLHGIDAAPCTLYNAAESLGILKESALLIDFGRQESRVMLVVDGRMRGTAHVPGGGDFITRRLQESLHLSYHEAEVYKCGGSRADEGVVPRDVQEELERSAREMASAIGASYRSMLENTGIDSVERIALFGQSAQLSMLREQIHRACGAPAEIAAPLELVSSPEDEFAPDFLEAMRSATGIAIGAALPWVR